MKQEVPFYDLLSWLQSILFSCLFVLHTFLAACGLQPLPGISQWMFRAGRASTSVDQESNMYVQELVDHTHNPRILKDIQHPIVIRGFFPKITVDELMSCAGPQTLVQTHRYEKGQVVNELMPLQKLTESVRAGMSTNAKSIVFQGSGDFSIFDGLAGKVDTLRDTLGMPWTELAMQFFIGGVGTFTRCHADPSLNCYLQLSGRKRWNLAPPSAMSRLSVLPRGRNISYHAHDTTDADWIVVDLNPGDLLVLPPFWFHEVTNIQGNDDVIVGLAMNWLSWKHAFAQSKLMATGSIAFRPRLWKRPLVRKNTVDDEIMRACRQVCSCSVGPAQEKTNLFKKHG